MSDVKAPSPLKLVREFFGLNVAEIPDLLIHRPRHPRREGAGSTPARGRPITRSVRWRRGAPHTGGAAMSVAQAAPVPADTAVSWRYRSSIPGNGNVASDDT